MYRFPDTDSTADAGFRFAASDKACIDNSRCRRREGISPIKQTEWCATGASGSYPWSDRGLQGRYTWPEAESRSRRIPDRRDQALRTQRCQEGRNMSLQLVSAATLQPEICKELMGACIWTSRLEARHISVPNSVPLSVTQYQVILTSYDAKSFQLLISVAHYYRQSRAWLGRATKSTCRFKV